VPKEPAFPVPATLFTNGWIHVLEDSKLAFILMVAAYHHTMGAQPFMITAADRLQRFGMKHDGYEAHKMLSRLGLVTVTPDGRRRADGTGQLPVAFACTRHGRFLREACPEGHPALPGIGTLIASPGTPACTRPSAGYPWSPGARAQAAPSAAAAWTSPPMTTPPAPIRPPSAPSSACWPSGGGGGPTNVKSHSHTVMSRLLNWCVMARGYDDGK
jgi:hypothetical protein